MKKPSKIPQTPEPEALEIDEEAQAFAEELITEATSAQYIAEEARNETYAEEANDTYVVDFTALDE